jgi:hypothetical protein
MFWRFLFLALGCLSVSVDLRAQARSDDPRTTSRVHLGPFYLTPAVSVSEFGLDTNVFNQAGERESDFTFTIAPRLTTAIPVARRALFTASTAAGLVYYHRYNSERSINPDLALRGELYLNRVTLFAQPSYLRTRERPSFEIDLRSRRVEQGTVAGIDTRILPKLNLELSVDHHRTVFDADEFFLGTSLAETLNRASWSYAASARWAATPLTTFVVRGESTKDRFLVSQIRNSDSRRVTAGVELRPRALISGKAEIGMRRLHTLNQQVLDFTGLVAAATLNYTLRGSTNFAFHANRDTHYSFELLEPYYVDTTSGVSVRQHLGGRLDAMVGFDAHRYAYRALVTDSGNAAPTRIDLTNSYSGSVGYRVGQSGRVAFGFVYWIRDSDTRDFRNYDGLRIGTSITYGLQ